MISPKIFSAQLVFIRGVSAYTISPEILSAQLMFIREVSAHALSPKIFSARLVFIKGVSTYAISPKIFRARTKDFGTYRICTKPSDKHQPGVLEYPAVLDF